jgi:hypothetical protein
MPRTSTPIDDLRLAIDCLPRHTREAMLEGVRTDDIIVGAYSDRHGGVCPMLAAHRHGGRTSFVSFAHAWDRFADAKRARRATRRELRVLEGHLEASLRAEAERGGGIDLAAAIREHQAAARERRAREARSVGVGWMRGRRDAADAERALAEAERRRQLVP